MDLVDPRNHVLGMSPDHAAEGAVLGESVTRPIVKVEGIS